MPRYRPAPSEFLTDLNAVFVQSSANQKLEPSICATMRTYLNNELKRFRDQELALKNRVFDKIKSKLNNNSTITDAAIAKVQTSYATSIDSLAKIATTYETNINKFCNELSTIDPINTVFKEALTKQAAQLKASITLAAIPAKCENEMQEKYEPVETYFNQNAS